MSFDELIRIYSKPMDIIPTGISEEGRPPDIIEAIFFDVYGTLFMSRAGDIGSAAQDSRRYIEDLGDLLRRRHIEKEPDVFLREFYAAIEEEKEKRKEGGIDYPEVDIETIWETVTGIEDRSLIRRCAIEYELLVNPVYPMPHVSELLARCRERRVPMGIVSNAQFYTPLFFSSLLGLDLTSLGFSRDFVFFSYLHGYCKPSLVLFERAARAIEAAGIPVRHVLYVGNDMLKDIYPAGMIGFHTVLFAGDGRSLNLRRGDERVRSVRPDMVVTDLSQILRCIG